jgi:cytochrome bd ubiquinol oxidase subunit I
LGIMLFGADRVSQRVHTLATLLVAIGTTLSAFWILSLNSWMHTPAGFEMRDGVAHATDWFAIVFNPSFPYRLAHMLLASGLTVAFLIAGISAWRWLHSDRREDVRIQLVIAVRMAALLIPIQILVGDLHGLNTLEHQPAKIAAMEGIWENERGAALRLFAIPDEASRTNHGEIKVPYLASWILTHELDGEVKGLNTFIGEHPPVAPLFYGFRLMVGVGVLMLLLSFACCWLTRRHASNPKLLPAWALKALVAMTFSGWIATLAGWYVTEIGRQPFLVYGVLRTSEAASTVPASIIGLSFALYMTVYFLLLLAYVRVLFLLARRAGNIEAAANPEARQLAMV